MMRYMAKSFDQTFLIQSPLAEVADILFTSLRHARTTR